jgi:hypothetical protein
VSDLVVVVLLLQHPVIVLVFKQYLCGCLAMWMLQETTLWATICPFQAAAHLLPTASWLLFQSLFILSSLEELPYPPSPAGFVYLQLTWGSAPLLMPGGESYKPATVVGFVYLNFVQETAPTPFSSALKVPHPLCYMSFSVPCLLFSFCFQGGISLSRGLCWFMPGVAVGCHMLLICSLIVLCLAIRFLSQHLVRWEPSWFSL